MQSVNSAHVVTMGTSSVAQYRISSSPAQPDSLHFDPTWVDALLQRLHPVHSLRMRICASVPCSAWQCWCDVSAVTPGPGADRLLLRGCARCM